MHYSNRLERFGELDEIKDITVTGSFWGAQVGLRMDLVREAINEIRSSWNRYPIFMEELRELMDFVDSTHPELDMMTGSTRSLEAQKKYAEYKERLDALLESTKEWESKSGLAHEEKYEAIRLYTSEIGYQRIFRAINMALRESGLIGLADNRKRLRSAVFLVELLNIDLFNYRERNQHADNFEGTVYRGMAISGIELERYYESLTGPLSERYQSVPLAMVSASRTPKAPIAFALHEAELDKETAPVIWEIHIHSLDPHLLASYHTKYPTSVVTSLCAVPIERISDLPIEEEVFLRGPFFQILGITVDYSVKFERPVHRITAVVLNSNRDHISAIASNKGADQRMRDLFRTMVLASRSTTCAEYAEELGRHADAKLYRTLAAESYSAIDHYLDEP